MSQDTPTTPAPTFTAEELEQRASVLESCGEWEDGRRMRFAASLVRREEQQGWQPIATAPMNGKPMLLWWDTRGASSGCWRIDYEREEQGWAGDQDICVPRDQEKCTHWMPLPAKPTEAP